MFTEAILKVIRKEIGFTGEIFTNMREISIINHTVHLTIDGNGVIFHKVWERKKVFKKYLES